MTTELLSGFKEIKNITNIFLREKKIIKFKSLIKILSKYGKRRVIKVNQVD
jgi:hypothetical protein